ncbi:TVP38/TMEM64 family protein [Nesterenkonia natronophila]|uniref:TVP38/TMEM64 family membrane protein n=1 Tax=Nesterenkonia natronophila TaxID=2174932 RepID=A0A3A4FCE8_9MICC|nr:TVP38/TMEM64 family protein [Nesterenkonia natronophila]RJN32777.1 TVP38/TMEM64 family protein [Nesterenkonia natronophila]
MTRELGEPVDDQERWVSVLRNMALGLVVLGLLWVAFNVELPPVHELQQNIEAVGWAGWIAFVGLYALVATTPIPVTIMAVAGGLLFDVVTGTILSVVGVMLGCWAAYWVARALGKQTMRKLLGRHRATVEQHLRDSGFYAVATLRLVPGIPYWPVNYGSGAFGVRHTPYVLASLASCIPGQFSLVAVGAFIADPSVLTGGIVAVGWAAVAILTVLAYRNWRRTRRPSSD